MDMRAAGGWPALFRQLVFVAMALFLVTIVIGIMNGLDAYEFDRNQVLTHVHSGTLGWITLSLAAASLWVFRRNERPLGWALAASIAIYVVAFYAGNLALRAITGVILMAVIVWLVVWVWRMYLATRSLPALAIALGFSTFFYGAVIGVLLQVQLASGTTLFPAGADIIGAHAATMVFSYLILVAMGLIEWRVLDTRGLPRAGLVQLGALFGGGVLLAVFSIFLPDQVQSIGGLYLLVELIAVILFVIRIVPSAVRVSWVAPTAERFLAASAVFVIAAVAIYLYLVSLFLADPTQPFEKFFPILAASDHAAFIGVITNLVFALVLALTADRNGERAWLTQTAFWLINLGLIVFLVGLAGEITEVKRIGAPVMGVGLVLGLAQLSARLWVSNLRAADRA